MKNQTMISEAVPDYFSVQVSDARRFYLGPEKEESKELAVVSAGCEHCDANYNISRTTFPYLSFEYVARGKGSLTLDGKRYELMPGTLFSYGPGVSQVIKTDSENRMVKYFVDFSGCDALDQIQTLGIPPGKIIQTSRPIETAAAFDRLIEEGLSQSPLRVRLCSTLLEYLILKISDTAIPYGSSETRAFYTYRKCLQYIEDNYLGLFSAEQAAGECHVDKAYICRLFKRFGKYTPYQYITRLKMNHAAELLQEPGKMVKQVSDELGFSDPYHFSRVFKRTHGLSPERFSKRATNPNSS